jgi:nucleoside-diphosphate-sugar epimerase
MAHRTTLVTGGCGFVGRHFAKRLLGMGCEVTVVDDLSVGVAPGDWPEHLKPAPGEADRLRFHRQDFRDFVRRGAADFDLIVHCAAVVGGRMTIEGDPLKVATDLAIDADLFNWSVKIKPMPRKVIYFSSSAAYPIKLQTSSYSQTLSEDLIAFDDRLAMPDMTYGWSKLTGEYLAEFAASTYGLDVVTYRPFSGYGEDQDFSYPFPSIVRRVGRRESPIIVWGSGDQKRDFIYIEDVVDAVFATCDKLEPGQALNLGSGVGTSFRDLAILAGRVIGHGATVANDQTKPEGVFARVGDCSKLFRWYRPTTPLEEGIRIAHEYQKRAGLLT